MNITRVGLEQIVFAEAGFLANLDKSIAMGIRGNASLEESQYKPIQDYLDRSWDNKINIKLEVETLQPTMKLLKSSFLWLNGNVDIQAIPNKQESDDAQDKAYVFARPNDLGIDFENVISSDKRSIKFVAERAFRPDQFGGIIINKETTGYVKAGENRNLLRRPYLIEFSAPQGSSLYSDAGEISSYNLVMKTKSTKTSENNVSIVDFISYELTIEVLNASFDARLVMMNKENAPSIKIKQQNNNGYYDTYDFAAGVLTLVRSYVINDETRKMIYKFKGNVFVHDHNFLFGAAEGGPANDDGTNGGTLKIGY